MLVDVMTNRGTLMSIHRKDTNKTNAGPLGKASFEESDKMLLNAAIFSEIDRMTGVSANTMTGQMIPCGTGEVEVVLDHGKLMNILDREDIMESEMINADALNTCGNNDAFDFDFDMSMNIEDTNEMSDFMIHHEGITTSFV